MAGLFLRTLTGLGMASAARAEDEGPSMNGRCSIAEKVYIAGKY